MRDAPSADPAASGAALVSLAGMYSCMSDDQREGRACPWCNTAVTPGTGVDLGARHVQGEEPVLHPFACRRCAGEQARAEYARHGRTCVACFRQEDCEVRRLLRRLALETRS
ncbi:hypothetical protein ACFVHR_04940 [Streptomyces sp. NPDC127168]|uniref:hypothetical protein n=1 Tax=unclassified Streptomyces TaxID=2593676 RepID=UPI00363BA71E